MFDYILSWLEVYFTKSENIAQISQENELNNSIISIKQS